MSRWQRTGAILLATKPTRTHSMTRPRRRPRCQSHMPRRRQTARSIRCREDRRSGRKSRGRAPGSRRPQRQRQGTELRPEARAPQTQRSSQAQSPSPVALLERL
eukprot:Amastigsp_a510160_20.p7 type:complete len:104 gc:universal Amastigsp_a510160_20:2360-2671(+)